MNDLITLIGKNIRTLRTRHHLSLEELSFQAQLNAAHLGQIERGLQNPTIDTLKRITDAMHEPFPSIFQNIPPVEQETVQASPTQEKIQAQLSKMTVEQQQDVLKIIRILQKNFK